MPVFQEAVEVLKQSSIARLGSVLRKKGCKNTFMHRVAPLQSENRMAGPAFSLRSIPAREDPDIGPLDQLKDVTRVGIEQIQERGVLVNDARGDTRQGALGSILAAHVGVRAPAVFTGAYPAHEETLSGLEERKKTNGAV